VPVTTAVQAHYQKEREIRLQESQQVHQIRTGYLDRIDKPGAARMRTLRLITAATDDLSLKQWAQSEMEQIQKEIGEFDSEIVLLDKEVAATEKELKLQHVPDSLIANPHEPGCFDEATRFRLERLQDLRTRLSRLRTERATPRQKDL